MVEGPLQANGRLELGHYLAEQAVSQTVHAMGMRWRGIGRQHYARSRAIASRSAALICA